MIIIYIDIVLLTILFALTVFTFVYCLYRVNRMRRAGQIEMLLHPTRVLFSQRKDDHSDELRTIVAYKNPITGEYCIHKSRTESRVYTNQNGIPRDGADSDDGANSDSGLSDEYEPMSEVKEYQQYRHKMVEPVKVHQTVRVCDRNVIEKTWNWNYKEYQI